jgi:hypothetical protein
MASSLAILTAQTRLAPEETLRRQYSCARPNNKDYKKGSNSAIFR